MNAKSLSPRIKPAIRKTKLVLKKLGSLQKINTTKPNDSINSIHHSDSQNSITNSILNSKLHSSSSRISLKLSNSSAMPACTVNTQHRLKAMADKYAPVKSPRLNQSVLDESLLPMNSEQVFIKFEPVLSNYELSELVQYSIIYYLGLKAKKIRPNDKLKHKGFDDKQTDYILVPGDHLVYQYEILELLGSGSFSQVCKCFDHKSRKEVAVKILKSHKRFEEQGQVELKVLAFVRKHDKGLNFVQMQGYFMFRGHLCIVFELLSFNLYDLLKANNFTGFSNTLARRFTVQVLKGLLFLKEHHIIHCDLKPENIILVSGKESIIKIIDMGSSCFEQEKIYFYIQSRIYRAPEIILGISYTTAIDMWSFGCIVAELITGEPLFQGESEPDQLNAIMEVLGHPPEDLLNSSSKKGKFFNQDGSVKNCMNSRGKIRNIGAKTLEGKLQTEDFVLVDFVKSIFYLGCLEWIPEKRMTPKEALVHPWVQEIKKARVVKGGKMCKSPRVRIQ